MGRLFKILGWVVGLALLLLVAAVVILPLVVDPNDYKDEIIARVQEQTGRNLKIDGDIDLSVFPWLGLKIGGLELSNAKGFGETPFAVVNKAAVRVQLRPLLEKRLVVDTVALDGMELNLARSKQGVGNWEDLAAAGAEAPEKGPQETPASGDGEAAALLQGRSIAGIDVTNARVDWDDRRSGQRLTIEQLDLQTGEVAVGRPVELKLDFVLDNREPALKARVGLQTLAQLDEAAGQLKLSDLKLEVDATGAPLPGGEQRLQLEAVVEAALDGSRVRVDGLKLSSGELRLDGGLQGKDLTGTPVVEGRLELETLDLARWMKDHGMGLPPMADPKALSRVGARLNLALEGETVRLPGLEIGLDDTRITGDALVKDGGIAFKVDVDSIDVDRYLPAAAPAAQAPQVQAAGAGNSAPAPVTGDEPALFPVETLRALNLDGVLRVARLTVSGLRAEAIQLTLKARDGRLKLRQDVKKFYQGDYRGLLDLDVTGKDPLTRIDAAAGGIQIGPLLEDMAGEGRLVGTGKFALGLKTAGNSVPAMRRGLGGELNFRFENGAVKGFNLAQFIRDTKARFKGEPVTVHKGPQQTDFSEISASGRIDRGVLTNRDLLAKSPFLRVTGKGQVDLAAETLDYTVTTVVVATEKGQGGEGLEELKGVHVPIHLTGALAAPAYEIDWASILLDSQKGRAKKELEKKIDKELKDKLPDGLRNQLKGLFN